MAVETDQPLISDETSDAAPPPMHQVVELHTSALLTILLDPEITEKLSPTTIMAADNLSLFHLLPLMMAAVQRKGELSKHRSSFVEVVSVFRNRIVACRGLKLRFLLLIQNPAFAAHWDVRLVHRRDCYAAAREALQQRSISMDTDGKSSSVEEVSELVSHASIERPLVTNWNRDNDSVISFASRKLLHPKHGIHIRSIMYHLRAVPNAFFATELVDGIMERANFKARPEGVMFAQRLLDLGIIRRALSSSKVFMDDRRRVYQCTLAMNRDDDGHCRVRTADGTELKSWEAVCDEGTKSIRQIEVQVPMDMIDLQSFEFWTNSVYVKNVEKGFRFGYRAIVHPLYCDGLSPQHYLKLPDLENPELSDERLESLEKAPSSASTRISSDDVNDLQQESAVVGSVVVRKVFSSIARPMIIQLRVPLENADLEDDNQHVVLPPGLLVKEGDNLMQDLGVEIMFQVFNHIWSGTPSLKEKYGCTPISVSYEVFPTSSTQGFMEALTGLTSLREFDFKNWRNKYGSDEERVTEMVRSTVGSYIGAYVVGYVLTSIAPDLHANIPGELTLFDWYTNFCFLLFLATGCNFRLSVFFVGQRARPSL